MTGQLILRLSGYYLKMTILFTIIIYYKYDMPWAYPEYIRVIETREKYKLSIKVYLYGHTKNYKKSVYKGQK